MEKATVRQSRLKDRNDWCLRIAYNDPLDKEAVKAFLEKNIWKGKAGPSELYDWKYDRNSFGKTLMVIGENEAKQVIGFGVFMPWQLCCGGRIIGAIQWVDLVVSFSYRGTGISSQILQDGLAEARRTDRSICFAFPNANSVPVHQKNNGFHLGHIVRYVKPLQTGYLVKRVIKAEALAAAFSKVADVVLRICSKETYALSDARIAAIEHCDSVFDSFWNRMSEEYPTTITTRKDSRYLNWKYLDTPTKRRTLYAARSRDEIRGFVVLEENESTGYIIDIAAFDQKTVSQLIAFSVNHFRTLRKDSVVFVCLENNLFVKDFKSFGFVERGDKKHFFIYLDEKLDDTAFFRDARNWFVTIGDCDIDSM